MPTTGIRPQPALTRRTFLVLTCLGGATVPGGRDARAADPDKEKGKLAMESVDRLVTDLDSDDGRVRLAASREIFRRGQDVAELLRKAGAKQPQTIAARRVDIVYGLLVGLEPGQFLPDSFGLRLDAKATADDVARMGKKYGFALSGQFNPEGVPNAYVKLEKGKSLAGVMKQLLTEEPLVRSLNRNGFE